MAEQVRAVFHDEKAEADACADAGSHLLVLSEDRVKHILGNADPRVDDLNREIAAAPPTADKDSASDRVLDRVLDQVVQEAAEKRRVGHDLLATGHHRELIEGRAGDNDSVRQLAAAARRAADRGGS